MSQQRQEIKAGEFKTHCLRLIDEVAIGHGELIITKRGQPLAKLVPFNEAEKSVFGYLQGTVEYIEDIDVII